MTRGLLTAAAVASAWLGGAALAQEPLSAARCAVAEMTAPTSAVERHDGQGGDPFARIAAWRALAGREQDGLRLYTEALSSMGSAPKTAKRASEQCAKEDPFRRLPTMTPPVAGNGLACLAPVDAASKLALAAMSTPAEQRTPAALCQAVTEVEHMLAAGQKAIEDGIVPCADPAGSWASMGSNAFMYRLLLVASDQKIDCAAVDQPVVP
ncbi:hypothetical protein [Caulobacter mirabilis]|uniref:hypothetical protein n=1 Tax=Caulobacter mirabilis TaxID=69666 RepID=UPI0012375AB0|nr:hypothetical protein [Caulobacter mirabilis]